MAEFRLNSLLKVLIKGPFPGVIISSFPRLVSIKIRRTIKIKPLFFFEYFSKEGKGIICCPLKYLFLWNYFVSKENGCREFKWINSVCMAHLV